MKLRRRRKHTEDTEAAYRRQLLIKDPDAYARYMDEQRKRQINDK